MAKLEGALWTALDAAALAADLDRVRVTGYSNLAGYSDRCAALPPLFR